MAKSEDYNDSFFGFEQTQGANKFNLAKKDFELFKEDETHGETFEAKLFADKNQMHAMIDRHFIFSINLNTLTDEDNLFLRSYDGFNFVIKSLKNKTRTEDGFLGLLESRV